MSDGRRASRVLAILAAVLVVLSIGGVITTAVLNAFVLDKFDAYGEVPIPGESTVYLPAGEVSVNFHTQVIGSPSGGGLPLPALSLRVTGPTGAAEPTLTESVGVTTSVNSDAHRRMWLMDVPAEGGYRVIVDGAVNGYINPRLAFGDNTAQAWPIWLFAGLGLLGADLAIAAWLLHRRRSRALVATPAELYAPTDEGARLEGLKTIAALRDSGALTEDEYEAEKRRILDGR